MSVFRWGILAPGHIARQFALGLQALPDHHLVAVGSRSAERGQAFAVQFGDDVRVHEGYEALIADSEVDAIYIASPHTSHRDQTLACLAGGKPVLCEKPMGINAAQVQAMTDASRQHGVFLMEAMWTRFLPIMHVVRQWIADGRIGELRMVQASFGFRCGWNPEHRLLAPELAGGATLDVGIYPVALAHDLFGAAPEDVLATGHLGETGVDEQTGILLRFAGGGLAILDTAVRTRTEHGCRISGTEGSITITPPFWKATTATLEAVDDTITKCCDHWGNGYEYEAAEVARCVRAGLVESDRMSAAQSLAVATTLDSVRARLGLSYPCEQA